VIDWTLDKVFAELRSRKAYHSTGVPSGVKALRAHCECGQNPFLHNFLAGEQALVEALMDVQAEEPSLDPVHRDSAVAELYMVIRGIARSEVELLCSFCKSRTRPTAPSS
jgi:hypothetical protein